MVAAFVNTSCPADGEGEGETEADAEAEAGAGAGAGTGAEAGGTTTDAEKITGADPSDFPSGILEGPVRVAILWG